MLFCESRRDFYPVCHHVEIVTERVCVLFSHWIIRRSAAQTFSDPPISLLTMLTHIPCSLILRGYKLGAEWEGELSLINNEFVLFCINNQAQLSVHILNNCFERVWRFLTLYKVFISTLRLNRTVCLFVFILLTRSNMNYSNWSTRIS